jgi:hypothetical protein
LHFVTTETSGAGFVSSYDDVFRAGCRRGVESVTLLVRWGPMREAIDG